MSEVARLPIDRTKARDHYDVTLEQLGKWLAEAEVMGGYRALHDHDVIDKVIWLAQARGTEEIRARFWEARLRGELEERK